jgi:hypothetical protein
MKRCRYCKKTIIETTRGSWRLYGFMAGILAVSQYLCEQDLFHEPEDSEISKVTEILLNYD